MTPFTILPAIDIKGGRNVRPVGGDDSQSNDYGDPLEIAHYWKESGASWIHLVDLDAAFSRGHNRELITRIINSCGVNVQLSGGLSDEEALVWALGTGAHRINISSGALVHRDLVNRVIAENPNRCAVALDVSLEDHEGKPADAPRPDDDTLGEVSMTTSPITEDSQLHYHVRPRGSQCDVGDLWKILDWLGATGVCAYTVTDVQRDGAMSGPGYVLMEAIARRSQVPMFASGGVRSVADLQRLKALPYIHGAVVGKAFAVEALDASVLAQFSNEGPSAQ
ncbi:HisA/HisF-related TIM barrel protein [Actinomyces vulturis]|uniref:HisA/HisF-related TIM barrel protein n=1 Tax=Actinomyces vulturis TaxID=1857645 RepID=UPI0008319D58|nr:HisA/HisF-related TIM barrel protein [Actinomyces vulturis]